MAGKAKTKAKSTPAKTKSTPKRKRDTIQSTEFCLHAPDAEEIFLAGEFNNWESNSKDYRMRKFKGDVWKKKVKLKPGDYEYQFVVNGNWWKDPENPKTTKSPYGSENSVISVK